MKFDFTDAWILQSIFYSESSVKGAEIIDIIAYADYANHAILTYTEFKNSVIKLISFGLIQQLENNLHTSEFYKNWWNEKFAEKKRIHVLKTINVVEKYLNKNFKDAILSPSYSDIPISLNDFNEAVDIYINQTNSIIKDLK